MVGYLSNWLVAYRQPQYERQEAGWSDAVLRASLCQTPEQEFTTYAGRLTAKASSPAILARESSWPLWAHARDSTILKIRLTSSGMARGTGT
jgi:hypothetical protein